MLLAHDLAAAPLVAKDPAEAIRLNCLLVASAAIEVEKVSRDRAISELTIPLYGPLDLGYDTKKLSAALSDLFLFALARAISVSFVPRPIQLSLLPRVHLDDSVACLFSGGVDSYVGILRAAETYHSVTGVFCAHSDQSKIIASVRIWGRRFQRHRNIALRHLQVPALGATGYIQLRGFLYVVAAGQVVANSRRKTLLVTEVGPTMFQPRFSPLDAITMTTHPEVMRLAGRCLGILLQEDVAIVTPHASLTKAEVMALAPDKAGLRHTHSCITQRFGDHDGTCYGCITRRLAGIASGIVDVRYRRNPIWDPQASGGNLLELLRFSADILIQPRRLEEFQRRQIDQFSVRNLFRRFALDNLSAVHSIAIRGGRMRPAIRSILGEVAHVVGRQRLDTRLDKLRIWRQ